MYGDDFASTKCSRPFLSSEKSWWISILEEGEIVRENYGGRVDGQTKRHSLLLFGGRTKTFIKVTVKTKIKVN